MIDKSKVIQLMAIVLLAFGNATLFGQTGPAGIGNANGFNGQPQNAIWLDAGALELSNDDPVTTWNDASGNINHAAQSDASEQPVYKTGVINGFPAVYFDGSNDHLSVPDAASIDISDGVSVIVVAKPESPDAQPRGLVSKRNSAGDEEAYYLFTHSNSYLYFNAATNRINGNVTATADPQIFAGNYDGSKTNPRSFVFNNGSQTGSGNGPTNVGAKSSDLHIGILNPGYGQGFRGDIAEVIIYRNALNAAQLQIVHQYLSVKYGINISNDLFSPVASYVYGVAGVGRASTAEAHLIAASKGLYLNAPGDIADGEYVFMSNNNLLNGISDFTASDLPSGTELRYNRIWYLEKTGSPEVRVSFDFSEASGVEKFPASPSNYVLLYRAGEAGSFSVVKNAQGVMNGDQVFFDLDDTELLDGYYTFGTEDNIESPLEGADGRTWYTLISGNWDNWEVWTLDPSGALPNNPVQYTPTTSPTANADKVFVLNGKTVEVTTNNKQHTQITMDGRLELNGTTGHSFGEIRGSGRVFLNSDNFPTGDATHFAAAGQGEGTVIYQGNSYEVTQNLTFYNLEIELDGNAEELTLLSNFEVNGELRIKRGALKFNDNTSTSAVNMTVKGNVIVEENGQMLTGTANNVNARHQLNLYGDFTNNGSVEFTNRTSAIFNSEATDGIVDVNFLNGSKNQIAFLNGASRFYRVLIDKGTDATYELAIEATHADHFKLFGYANQGHGQIAQLPSNTNALGLLRGTVRIKSNISIPVLNNSGNYNISEAARLWVDGGYVAKTSGTAIVPYGAVQVSAGTLDALVPSGITTRGNALVRIDGGTLNLNQLRTSVFGSENVGGYIQTGGTTNVLGGSTSGDYYCFNLTYPGNVFSMSGGTLHIHQSNTKGGVFINSDPTNVNITGGKVIFNIGNANDFVITSKAPFYNLEMTKSVSNSAVFRLDGGQSGTGGSEVTLGGQDLRVLSDLRLRGKETDGSYPNIDFYAVTDASNVNDVYIGGSLNIEAGAQYWTAADGNRTLNYDGANRQPSIVNTTFFNQTIGTSAIDTLYWGNTGDQFDYNNNGAFVDLENLLELGHFVLNRTSGNTLRLVSPDLRGNSSLTVDVNGDASVLSGTFDQGRLTFRIWGSITNYDRFGTYFSEGDYPVSGGTPNVAQIRFREDPPVVINTSENAVFGNIRFNVNPNHTVELNSDVYIERMEFMNGSIYIKNHQLKVDDMRGLSTDIFEDVANSSTLKVTDTGRAGNNIIYTNGKASDGGLVLKITQNSLAENQNRRRNNISPVTFPIGFTSDGGTTIYYRPAQINVQGLDAFDEGYVRIRPVSGELQTTELTGGEMLQQYWRVSYSDFENIPDQMAYRFYYRNQTGVAGVDLPAGAAGEDDYVPGFVLDGGSFARDYESSSLPGDVDDVFASSYDADTRVLIFNGTSSAGEFIHGSGYAGFEGINANYTAGLPARFLGAPRILYNLRGGGWGGRDWGATGSWRTTPEGGSAPSTVPGPGDIVFIRGSLGTDAINVDGNREVAEVIMQREGVYTDIEDLQRLRFSPGDQLTAAKVTGVGELYLQRNMGSQPIIIADIGEFASNDTSLVNYYLTENGTYNVQEEDFFSELPTLRIYGQNSTSRHVSFNYDLQMKNLIIDGSARLLVGGNYMVENRTRLGFTGDGRIEFPNGNTPYTLSTGEFVTGKGKTGSGDNFQVTVASGGANAVDHVFEVRENIHLGFTDFNRGSGVLNMNFYTNAADNNVILRLAGDGAHSFINEYAVGSSTINLYRIEMNKGADVASSFTLTPNLTLNGPTSGVGVPKAIQLNSGTLIFDNASYDFALTTGDDDFFIPATAALEVRQGQLTASGNSGILLDGRIIVSGGTLDMSGGNNYIEYTASGNSRIDISSGELIVGSQIRRGLTSSEGSLKYSQSGGKVVVGTHAAPENNRGVFEILNDGSNFTFTGGELEISRAQITPSFASLYLDPKTSLIGDGATLKMGNALTPPSQTMGIYSNISLPNIHVNNVSGNNPAVRQWTVPLNVGRLLQVDAVSVFDANGLDLIIRGDMEIDGSFVSNDNTTWFSGSTDQQISGAVTFYNLHKTSASELELNNPIIVTRALHHDSGLLLDNGNDLTVRGNLKLDGDHQWGNAGRGIVMEGVIQQTITGSGSFGKLTVNNANGVLLTDANNIVVENALQLEQGVLNIGSNLMTLSQNAVIIEENPFSATNMVTTNVSFTDNGIKKLFPAGAGNFVFPVGSAGKYTPVSFNISSNSLAGGSILVKPAGEYHPSVDDPDNVLHYHWVLRAEDLSGFSATATMKFEIADVKGNIESYIAARLLSDGTGEWNKFSGEEAIDADTQELFFVFESTDEAGVSGDYTAGLDAAIPDLVPTYISTTNGNWNNASTWDTYPVSGGSVPGGGPRGSMVIVAHEVDIPVNYISSYRTAIAENGVLSVGETFGHRLGEVSGAGVLSLERGDLPAGFYETFTSAAGGTFRFGGNENYDVLSTLPVINNLEFIGSGLRRLPNLPIQLLGDLTINGPVLRNEQNRKLSIKGDVAFSSGSFEAGTGATSIVEFNGTASQTVSGNADFNNGNSFNRLTINNPAGVVFTLDADVKDVLNLSAGRVIVEETAQFRVDNYSADAIVGASSTRYINGPLYKKINSGASFDFPLGNESRYGNILVTNVTAEGMWRAQYHSSSPNGAGLSTSSKEAPVEYVSSSEYWNIEAPATGTAEVTLRWDASSGVNPAESGLRGVQWLTDKWHEVTLSNVSGTSSAGTARIPSLTFNANPGEGNYITFGAITIPAYTWTGATDTDWFKPGNWTDSTVPSASAHTTIASTGNLPMITGANVAQVNNLIIEAGADLTVASNGKLTVNGDLTMAATSELILDNAYGVNGMASLITHGQILGDGSTRIRLTTPPNQWFYLGSSIKDAIFSNFSAGDPDIIINVYRANQWWGIKSGLAHRSLRPMEGIVTNLLMEGVAPDRLIEYTGVLHTAAVSRIYDESGYHLLANPYPSFISWEDAAGWERPNVSGTIWYRGKIGAEMAFITYNRDALPNAKVALYPDTEVTFTTEEELSLIPPMQAVWVSTSVPGVTVTVKPEARRHGIAGSMLKSSSTSRYGDVIRIETENAFSRDGAVLYFSNGSEEGLDKGDSEKYFNDSERIPEIYTRVGEKALSINGLPLMNEAARTIPLSVRNRIAGEVTMKFDLSYYYGQHAPYLEDRETGAFINLLHENSYTYTVSETGDNHDRFVLNFYYVATDIETPAGDETDAGSAITIKSMAGKVLVSVGMDLLQDGNGTVEIYTIEGRKISEVPARSSRTLILLPDERGVYVIRAKFGNQVKSGRVIGGR